MVLLGSVAQLLEFQQDAKEVPLEWMSGQVQFHEFLREHGLSEL